MKPTKKQSLKESLAKHTKVRVAPGKVRWTPKFRQVAKRESRS